MGSPDLDAFSEFAGVKVRLRAPRVEDSDALFAFDQDTDGARHWGETMRSRSGIVRRISAEHSLDKLERFTGRQYR